MRQVLFIMFFFCTMPGNAQVVYTGRLVSALTGKPITSAIISVQNPTDEIIYGVDSMGYFKLRSSDSSNIALDFSTTEVGGMLLSGLTFKAGQVLTLQMRPDCDYSASTDIRQDKIKLLMVLNAFSPQLTKKDRAFEKKYRITYHNYGDGCTGVITDCIDTYNHAVAQYLDKKFGKGWRRDVNTHVPAL